MPALLDVARRPAEPADQEVAKPLFGARQILFRIHRPENWIVRDLRVERANEAREAVVADGFVDVLLGHDEASRCARASRAASCSASFLARPVAEPSTSPFTTTS